MEFVTFSIGEEQKQAGIVMDEYVYSLYEISGRLPEHMSLFIEDAENNMNLLRGIMEHTSLTTRQGTPLTDVKLHAPLQNPNSVRDFMAFEAHVVNTSKTNGSKVHPNWYEFPAFYFSNHTAIYGPNDAIERPPNCEMLDYELEIAIIIGKEGRNIPVERAEEYIFGYTIFNDWSARDFQFKEMPIGLGPTKGKDLGITIGPSIITPNRLEPYRKNKGFDLEMTASVNGNIISKGNLRDIYYSFSEMIAHASSGATLYPGDILGSGTVGTGCLLEFGPEIHPWLQDGDEVELSIDQIGILRSKVKGLNESRI